MPSSASSTPFWAEHTISAASALFLRRLVNRGQRARVVLFIHVPKCGGTSVRDIFRWHNWSMTYWSNSQRLTGWKANRLLANIRSYLARNDTRIFVSGISTTISALCQILSGTCAS